MAVRSDKGLARNRKTLEMNLMAYSVARTRKVYSVLFCNRTYKAVIVGIFKAVLQRIMVDIGHRALGFDPRYPHGLKLKVRHGSGRILSQGLIYSQAYVAARCHFSRHKVVFNYFFSYAQSHCKFLQRVHL